MSLLPSRPDASTGEEASPRVVDVDSDDADAVLSALSAATARDVLSALHDAPAPASELADQVDTSVQNVKYHLDNLESAGAIEVVDTAYSAKGREMDVYAPADQPLIIYAGDEEAGGTLRTALARLLGSVGVLTLASVLVQAMYGESLIPWSADGDGSAPAGDGDGSPDAGGTTATDGGDASGDDPTTDGGDATTDGDGGMTTTDAGDGSTNASSDGVDVDADENVTEVNDSLAGNVTDSAGPDELQAATDAAANIPPGLVFFAGGLLVVILLIGYLTLREEPLY